MGLVDRDEAALPAPPVQGMEGREPHVSALSGMPTQHFDHVGNLTKRHFPARADDEALADIDDE